jgi:hypothetical protein
MGLVKGKAEFNPASNAERRQEQIARTGALALEDAMPAVRRHAAREIAGCPMPQRCW